MSMELCVFMNKCWSVTNSMEQSPSSEAISSADQQISCLLWTQKVHYCVHKSLSLDCVLSQLNLVHILTYYFFKIHSNALLPSMLMSSKWFIPFSFSDKFLCISLLLYVCYKLVHLSLLVLIILIIFNEEYKLCSSSLQFLCILCMIDVYEMNTHRADHVYLSVSSWELLDGFWWNLVQRLFHWRPYQPCTF
jgi:hypothetical protein